MKRTAWVLALTGIAFGIARAEDAIDREALVRRHAVTVERVSMNEVLQVGNGEIAYGIDPTGLQTFHGNTMSQWSWHSVPCPVPGEHAALKLEDWDFHGRALGYRSSKKGQDALYNWMRENPHRFNLGRLRFLVKMTGGMTFAAKDMRNIRQRLDPWTGVIECFYEVEGVPVSVTVCADPASGALAVQAESALISSGRMSVELAFPYGDSGKSGAAWNKPDAHMTTLVKRDGAPSARFEREMDGFRYAAVLAWEGSAELKEVGRQTYTLTPVRDQSATLTFTFLPSRMELQGAMPMFASARAASEAHWSAFWRSGGAVDLSGSADPRWMELERRVVLSQYLLAVNEAGSLPPQQSGLYNNSGWYGKFQVEMHWWHGAHYGLWGRWPMMERSLGFYFGTLPKAKELALSQGFTGARWPKMVGPDVEEAPSVTGPMMIWQQPHPIFYAMLEYRLNPSQATLEKWAGLIDETAEFMASYAFLDEKRGEYVLGPALSTMPETSDYRTTLNPTFELSYWRTGLRWAQEWREKLGKPRVAKWDDVIARLAPLPVADGVYLLQEGMMDTYTKMNWSHPSHIGPCGMLPGDGADTTVVAATIDKVWSDWSWNQSWGWNFPLLAMAAVRNGKQGLAMDALMHASGKNDINVVGLSAGGPFPAFSSNGTLLYAVALMAAGWDGAPAGVQAPGFPQDGSWTVKWEGLSPAP